MWKLKPGACGGKGLALGSCLRGLACEIGGTEVNDRLLPLSAFSSKVVRPCSSAEGVKK